MEKPRSRPRWNLPADAIAASECSIVPCHLHVDVVPCGAPHLRHCFPLPGIPSHFKRWQTRVVPWSNRKGCKLHAHYKRWLIFFGLNIENWWKKTFGSCFFMSEYRDDERRRPFPVLRSKRFAIRQLKTPTDQGKQRCEFASWWRHSFWYTLYIYYIYTYFVADPMLWFYWFLMWTPGGGLCFIQPLLISKHI